MFRVHTITPLSCTKIDKSETLRIYNVNTKPRRFNKMQLIGVAEYFWKDHGSKYPILQQLAERFLRVSAGSTGPTREMYVFRCWVHLQQQVIESVSEQPA